MLMRFVIGRTANKSQESELMQEHSKHGGFLRLDLEVHFTVCITAVSLLLLGLLLLSHPC